MRVSYAWVSQYVDLQGISPQQVAEALTLAGVEVEEIVSCDRGITGVVIGQVEEVHPHPEANRLQICKVRTLPSDPSQTIVCGATNVAVGQRVPVARVGATLPGGVVISKSCLRGVESEGMICSAEELDIPYGFCGAGKGIWVLPANAPLGEDVVAYLGLDDTVFVCAPTANRTDVLGMQGMAIEVGAILGRAVEVPAVDSLGWQEDRFMLRDMGGDMVPFYAIQHVSGLQDLSTPIWLQRHLIAAGVSLHSPIVDVTHWVSLDTGQPMHAYDAEKVKGDLRVRRARGGESLEASNGHRYSLQEDHLVVSDDAGPLSLAGVIGGQRSQVSAETGEIFLEAACFSALSIRATAHHFRCSTASALRFSRGGVSSTQVLRALTRAGRLLQNLVPTARIATPVLALMGTQDPPSTVIKVRHDRITKILGENLSPQWIVSVFQRLQLPVVWVDSMGVYEVTVDDRRSDLVEEIDLIEEVIRLHGCDRIKQTIPRGVQKPQALTAPQRLRRQVRQLLTHWGWQEASTYSLVRADEMSPWGSHEPMVSLANPLSQDHAVLRTSLLPSLLRVAAYHIRHGQAAQRWFELAKTYHPTRSNQQPFLEKWSMVCLGVGEPERTWEKREIPAAGNVTTLQGLITSLSHWLGVQVVYGTASLTGWHPGRIACVRLIPTQGEGERLWGHVGQIHPEILQRNGLPERVSAAVLDWEMLDAEGWLMQHRQSTFRPWSRFPSVHRDISLVVDKGIPVASVTMAIRTFAGSLLKTVSLFDVFSFSENQQSLAYTLIYQSDEKTLTEGEVQMAYDQLVTSLAMEIGATLRQGQ
ncbi:phenylalanine--tRNA ligase subunit beta [Pasteuria penetrans]|nr:phenylalanine--tRNA ligase subunit beta [Pasteuria penetrans]